MATKTYWTIQAHSAEDGWQSWFGTYATFHAAAASLARFREQNQVQPVRILKHLDTWEVVVTDPH